MTLSTVIKNTTYTLKLEYETEDIQTIAKDLKAIATEIEHGKLDGKDSGLYFTIESHKPITKKTDEFEVQFRFDYDYVKDFYGVYLTQKEIDEIKEFDETGDGTEHFENVQSVYWYIVNHKRLTFEQTGGGGSMDYVIVEMTVYDDKNNIIEELEFEG